MGLLTDSEKGLLNQDSIEEARKGKIVYLDLEDIRLNPENIWTVNDEEIRIKRQSIEEVGLLQPLLVKKTQNGYLLNTGHKRYLAIEQITREGGDYMYLGRRLKGLVPCQYLDESLGEDDKYCYSNSLSQARLPWDNMKTMFSDLRDQRITAHEEVRDNLMCTVYSSGTEIYVNYNDKAVTVGGITVDPMGFVRVN